MRNDRRYAAVSGRVLAGAALLLLMVLASCRLTPTGSPLSAQAMAPPMVLASTLGQLNSQSALASGPLVLVFYRGHF